MSEIRIQIRVNGEPATGLAEPRTHLADFLREDLLLTGTHVGCEQGVCGACTVFVDGRPTRSCITFAVACAGADIRTVEGFEEDPLMSRIRQAFQKHHALQCGYCTPGMLTTAYDIVRRIPDADEVRIRRELSGNLCRCTGYVGIVAAIREVLANNPPAARIQPMARSQRVAEIGGIREVRAEHRRLSDTETDLPSPESLACAAHFSRTLELDTGMHEAWAVLADPERIVTCVPGAGLIPPINGPRIAGQFVVGMGPVKAIFRGAGLLTLHEAGRTGRLVGRGRDRFSRTTLEGMLDFTLSESGPTASKLTLDMRYRLAGPLSQFSRPELVAKIADRILGDVTCGIESRVRGEPSDVEAVKSLDLFSFLFAPLRAMMARFFGRG